MRFIRPPTSVVSLFALSAFMLAFAIAASAAPIGTLNVGSGGTITVSLASFAFNPDPSAHPAGPPWNAEVANGTTLTFAGCPSGVLGTPGCLDSGSFSPAEAIEVANAVPITLGGGLGPNNPFLQFAGNGITHATLLFTLFQLGPGSPNTVCSGLSIGQSCSVFAGSPLIMTDMPTGTALSLPAAGTATDGAGTADWAGLFTFGIAGMSPFDLQQFFCPSGTCTPADFASGRSVTSSFSGQFSAKAADGKPVPEPASLLLLGVGITALGAMRRKLQG